MLFVVNPLFEFYTFGYIWERLYATIKKFFYGCYVGDIDIIFGLFMGMFVVSKRYNGEYKFTFSSRKGKTIFTSIACKKKKDCGRMIAGIKENGSQFTFTKYKKSADKHFFRISKDGLVLANSRKYTTDLLLQKGIDEFIAHSSGAEILDFSENSSVFIDEEVGLAMPE